jgi:hypothetical protein
VRKSLRVIADLGQPRSAMTRSDCDDPPLI